MGISIKMRYQIEEVAGHVFASSLAAFLKLFTGTLCKVEVRGLENYSGSPSTIITINHKTDLDILIIAPPLHFKRSLLRPSLRPWFIASEEIFETGYLSNHFNLPSPLGRFLHRLNLTPVMKLLRAYPLRQLTSRKVGEILWDAYRLKGNLPVDEVLKKSWIIKLGLACGEDGSSPVYLKDLLGYSHRALFAQKGDLTMLKSDLYKALRPLTLSIVERQLNYFVELLDQGYVLFLAPEGDLSPDGRFWPVKSGLHRLIQGTSAEVTLLPVNITYDSMIPGRTRVYVTVGKELSGLKGLTKVELEVLVKREIEKLGVVTISQLGSHYICQALERNIEVIDRHSFTGEVLCQSRKFKDSGASLEEGLLSEPSLKRRCDEFIRYCVKGKWLLPRSPGLFHINKQRVKTLSSGDSKYNPILYSNNEFSGIWSAYGLV